MAKKNKPNAAKPVAAGGLRAFGGPPYIAVFIDDPTEHQYLPQLPHAAKGRTICYNGAVVQSMTRQVNRTSLPQLIGDVTGFGGPNYNNWTTQITGGDCPTPGDYQLIITAKDAVTGFNFQQIRNFQAP
jgi:hypothetical protein